MKIHIYSFHLNKDPKADINSKLTDKIDLFTRIFFQYPCDDQKYDQMQEQQLSQWEESCQCCGACCGIVDGDPYEHLIESASGKYQCAIYESRFGLHQTKSGKPFKCVPIREILHMPWPGNQNCSYKRQRNSI